MTDDPIRKEVEALKADIAQLRDDIAALSDAVKGVAAEGVADARSRAEEQARETWQDIEQRCEDLLEEGKATFDRAGEKVGEHPAGSILTAFGLGFIIARLFEAGRRH